MLTRDFRNESTPAFFNHSHLCFLLLSKALYFYGTGSGQSGNWYTKTEDGKTWSDPVYLKSNFGGDPAIFGTGSGDGYGDSLIIATQMVR